MIRAICIAIFLCCLFYASAKTKKRRQIQAEVFSIIDGYCTKIVNKLTSPIPSSEISMLLPIQGAMLVHISKIYGLNMGIDDCKQIAKSLSEIYTSDISVYEIDFNSEKTSEWQCSYKTDMNTKALSEGQHIKENNKVFSEFLNIDTQQSTTINAEQAKEITKKIGGIFSNYLQDNFQKIDEVFNNLSIDEIIMVLTGYAKNHTYEKRFKIAPEEIFLIVIGILFVLVLYFIFSIAHY